MITNRFKKMWPAAIQVDEKSKIHLLPCDPTDIIKCLSKNSITAENISMPIKLNIEVGGQDCIDEIGGKPYT